METDGGDSAAPPPADGRRLLGFTVYRRRWFVLLLLCLLNCSNATVWLTFAPVAVQSAQYLQVGLEAINWLSLVFVVVAIPLSFATTWMLDTLGLKFTLILGSWLNMLGAVTRFCGTLGGQQGALFPVVMLGQTLGALAQPFIIFAPTKMAALWFHDQQRATANMIASMSAAEQGLPAAAAVLRRRRRPVHRLLHTAGADPVCPGLLQRLRGPLRRPIHRVRRSGGGTRRRLRRQDQEVHGGHQGQLQPVCSGLHRLLRGVSGSASERCRGDCQLSLRVVRLLHLSRRHGAVGGVFLPRGGGHVRRAGVRVRAGPVPRLHRPPAGFDHAPGRRPPVHLWEHSELEGAHDGDGGALQRLLLLLRPLLPHAVPPAGGRAAGGAPHTVRGGVWWQHHHLWGRGPRAANHNPKDWRG
ncbi:solute carrier family 49 member A3 isoform X3 [Antennarius striatus]|uniref:solute carrier family 49 member A3 isoform X3 n=1 Tax=Antennarius striatus TaxID=241820 RepID=UPI0035B00343